MNTHNAKTQNHDATLQNTIQTGTGAPIATDAHLQAKCVSLKSKIVNPEPPLPSALPHVKPPRRLAGKVARLPHVVRTLVNTMLDDGFTYNAIVCKLQEIGYPGFVHQNIQRWKNRGYQTWLREREQRLQSVVAHLSQTPIAAISGV